MSDSGLLVRARLGGEQSLAVFRVVLDVVARPGRILALPNGVAKGAPPAVVPVLALADLDVAVATLESDGDTAWATRLRSVTGCRLASPDDADMVVALRPPTADDVRSLRTGSAHAPEHGPRLFVACASLAAGRSDVGTTIRLHGPGASNGRTLTVGGVGREVFDALATANRSFPAGIDSWFVAPDGRIAGIPRSSRIEILEEVV